MTLGRYREMGTKHFRLVATTDFNHETVSNYASEGSLKITLIIRNLPASLTPLANCSFMFRPWDHCHVPELSAMKTHVGLQDFKGLVTGYFVASNNSDSSEAKAKPMLTRSLSGTT
jgi:hypothetical protein